MLNREVPIFTIKKITAHSSHDSVYVESVEGYTISILCNGAAPRTYQYKLDSLAEGIYFNVSVHRSEFSVEIGRTGYLSSVMSFCPQTTNKDGTMIWIAPEQEDLL